MIRKIFRKAFVWSFRNASHSEEIDAILKTMADLAGKNMVIVESGCGATTPLLAKYGLKYGAKVYSIDYNKDKIEAIKKNQPQVAEAVNFIIGDSHEALKDIQKKETKIDFLFLDSAASAMHTFKEFQIVEKLLQPGSIILIDNAAIPGAPITLTAVRKGKILVPYLLSSANWKVIGRPRSGDSMVKATKMEEHEYSDFNYENPEYVDNWKRHFKAQLNKN